MDDYLTIFRSGMWRLNYQLSWEGQKRFFSEFLPLLHDTKAQVLGERDNNSKSQLTALHPLARLVLC